MARLCAFALAAWAQADIVAQGEALVRAGRYADAYQLLEPHEDRLAGDIKFDYLLARSALETGRPSKASFIYERILAQEPNYVGVRLEMGRAYIALSLGGELIHALSERFSAFAGGDLRGRWYNNVDVAEFSTADARAGLGYSEGATNVRVGVNGGRYWLDHEKTRDSLGLNADYRYLLTRQDQLNVNAGATRFRFIPESFKVNDFNLYQLAIGWLRGAADGRGAFGLTVLAGRENATNGRADGDKPFWGARLTAQTALSESVGAFFLGGVQRGKYSDVNVLFDSKRVDSLYDVTAGMTWSFARNWSLRPQVVYYKNKSNLPLFEYDRTDVSVNLRRDF